MTAFETFKALQKKQQAYQYVLNVLGWDSNTEAPKHAFPYRAEMQSIISQEVFSLMLSEEYQAVVKRLFETKDQLPIQDRQEIERAHESLQKMVNIPPVEYAAYQKLLSLAQRTWEDAKKENNYHAFKDTLGEIIQKARQMITYRNQDKAPYDVLLDDYEKGMNMEKYDAFFDALRKDLVPFVKEVLEHRPKKPAFIDRHFPKAGQKEFVEYLNEVFHYDLDRGLLKRIGPSLYLEYPSWGCEIYGKVFRKLYVFIDLRRHS